MSLHRTKATFIGLLEAGRVNEWVVTEKLGEALKTKTVAKATKKPRLRIGERYAYFQFSPFFSLTCLMHNYKSVIVIFILFSCNG